MPEHWRQWIPGGYDYQGHGYDGYFICRYCHADAGTVDRPGFRDRVPENCPHCGAPAETAKSAKSALPAKVRKVR